MKDHTQMPKYITTPDHYYLVVHCDIDFTQLDAGCEAHASLQDMYVAVSNATGLELCDIENGEWFIDEDRIVYDSRGCSIYEPLANVEEYLNTFEI